MELNCFQNGNSSIGISSQYMPPRRRRIPRCLFLMREIMIALDNVGTLDIPHRLLLTNIHRESVGKADVGDALVQIPAFFNTLGHSGDPLIDESALLGDVILRDHGAVAGNNVIHIFQRFQEIQAFQQSVNVGGMQSGLAAGKDGITTKATRSFGTWTQDWASECPGV